MLVLCCSSDPDVPLSVAWTPHGQAGAAGTCCQAGTQATGCHPPISYCGRLPVQGCPVLKDSTDSAHPRKPVSETALVIVQ